MRTTNVHQAFLRRIMPALVAFLMPVLAFAKGNAGLGETQSKLCSFLQNLTTLLNLASIAIVTIAIIFSGYQIAFAHKRINDVAPILIGGLLIGAAAQIARMLIGDQSYCGIA